MTKKELIHKITIFLSINGDAEEFDLLYEVREFLEKSEFDLEKLTKKISIDEKNKLIRTIKNMWKEIDGDDYNEDEWPIEIVYPD